MPRRLTRKKASQKKPAAAGATTRKKRTTGGAIRQKRAAASKEAVKGEEEDEEEEVVDYADEEEEEQQETPKPKAKAKGKAKPKPKVKAKGKTAVAAKVSGKMEAATTVSETTEDADAVNVAQQARDLLRLRQFAEEIDDDVRRLQAYITANEARVAAQLAEVPQARDTINHLLHTLADVVQQTHERVDVSHRAWMAVAAAARNGAPVPPDAAAVSGAVAQALEDARDAYYPVMAQLQRLVATVVQRAVADAHRAEAERLAQMGTVRAWFARAVKRVLGSVDTLRALAAAAGWLIGTVDSCLVTYAAYTAVVVPLVGAAATATAFAGMLVAATSLLCVAATSSVAEQALVTVLIDVPVVLFDLAHRGYRSLLADRDAAGAGWSSGKELLGAARDAVDMSATLDEHSDALAIVAAGGGSSGGAVAAREAVAATHAAAARIGSSTAASGTGAFKAAPPSSVVLTANPPARFVRWLITLAIRALLLLTGSTCRVGVSLLTVTSWGSKVASAVKRAKYWIKRLGGGGGEGMPPHAGKRAAPSPPPPSGSAEPQDRRKMCEALLCRYGITDKKTRARFLFRHHTDKEEQNRKGGGVTGEGVVIDADTLANVIECTDDKQWPDRKPPFCADEAKAAQARRDLALLDNASVEAAVRGLAQATAARAPQLRSDLEELTRELAAEIAAAAKRATDSGAVEASQQLAAWCLRAFGRFAEKHRDVAVGLVNVLFASAATTVDESLTGGVPQVAIPERYAAAAADDAATEAQYEQWRADEQRRLAALKLAPPTSLVAADEDEDEDDEEIEDDERRKGKKRIPVKRKKGKSRLQ